MPAIARWIPAVMHAGLLFALSAQPELRLAEEPALDTVLRKAGHLGAYALLAMLVAYALRAVSPSGLPSARDARSRLALLLVVAYAVSDEAHQAFVPGRGPSLLDVAIDGVGAVLGMVALRAAVARIGRRRRDAAT